MLFSNRLNRLTVFIVVLAQLVCAGWIAASAFHFSVSDPFTTDESRAGTTVAASRRYPLVNYSTLLLRIVLGRCGIAFSNLSRR